MRTGNQENSNGKLETRNSKLLLIGHRGASRYAPENTVAAFELALEHGCDGFEFDVRQTSDGRAVICHDSHFAGCDIARSKFDSLVNADSSLPLLEDVVIRFHSRAFLYIELKVAGLEDAVLAALRASPPERGYVVASFLPKVLRSLDHLERTLSCGEGCGTPVRGGRIPLGLICGTASELARWPELPIDYAMPTCSLVSRELADELHAASKRVIVWTVNSERDMRAMAELGVDGIVSDDTQLLCRTVGNLRRQIT
jgi:glycerophosphoryl diester phosphodiesterase